MKEQAEETIFALEKENRELQEKNRTLRQENAGFKGDLKAHERQKKENQFEISKLEKKMGNVRSAKALEEDLADRDRKIMDLEDEILDNEKTLQRVERELETKEVKYERLRSDLGSRTEELHLLKYKLNEYQKKYEKYSSVEKKITILVRENEQLKRDLGQKTPVALSGVTNNTEWEDKLQQIQEQVEDLRELVKRLKKQLKEAQEQRQEAIKKAKMWEELRDKIAEEKDRLEYRYEDKVEENERKTLALSKAAVKIFVMMAGFKMKVKEIERTN